MRFWQGQIRDRTAGGASGRARRSQAIDLPNALAELQAALRWHSARRERVLLTALAVQPFAQIYDGERYEELLARWRDECNLDMDELPEELAEEKLIVVSLTSVRYDEHQRPYLLSAGHAAGIQSWSGEQEPDAYLALALADLLRCEIFTAGAPLQIAPTILECVNEHSGLDARWVETLGLDWEIPAVSQARILSRGF